MAGQYGVVIALIGRLCFELFLPDFREVVVEPVGHNADFELGNRIVLITTAALDVA